MEGVPGRCRAGHPPVRPLVRDRVANARRVSFFRAMTSESHVMVRLPPAHAAKTAKAPKSTPIWLFLVMLVGGMAVGYFGARFGLKFLQPIEPKSLLLVLLLAVPFLWLLAVGFHELGHVVGGWITGGRFVLWIVGPLKVQRTPAGVKLAWNRSVNLGGGMAICAPLEASRITPERTAIMVLGGPAFSLVLAVALVASTALLTGPGAAESTWGALLHNVALVGAGLSSLIFVITIIPSTIGGFKTDGKHVLDLLRGGTRSAQSNAVQWLSTAVMAGVRPADLDPRLVERALSLGDGSLFDLNAHLIAYYVAADQHDWARAQRHLNTMLAGEGVLAPFMRDVVRCEYAWLLALRGNNPTAARAWLDAAGATEFDPATRLRAEAAVLLAEGRPAEAATKAREGLHALEHKSVSPAKSPFAEDGLLDLLDRSTGTA